MQVEVRRDVCEGEDLVDGVGLECRGPRGEVGLVVGAWARDGDAAVGAGEGHVRGHHFGVEHDSCGGVGDGEEGLFDVGGVDGGELVDLGGWWLVGSFWGFVWLVVAGVINKGRK